MAVSKRVDRGDNEAWSVVMMGKTVRMQKAAPMILSASRMK
jgi:hypothetical protein